MNRTQNQNQHREITATRYGETGAKGNGTDPRVSAGSARQAGTAREVTRAEGLRAGAAEFGIGQFRDRVAGA